MSRRAKAGTLLRSAKGLRVTLVRERRQLMEFGLGLESYSTLEPIPARSAVTPARDHLIKAPRNLLAVYRRTGT